MRNAIRDAIESARRNAIYWTRLQRAGRSLTACALTTGEELTSRCA
jgi:hypothetical protein